MCDKRGLDGSGKANLIEDGDACVWGVVYEMETVHLEGLDAHERGYERVSVEVSSETGEELRAETYVAFRLTDDAVAFDWYKQLIVDGAREHRLPADYVQALLDLPARPDARRRR